MPLESIADLERRVRHLEMELDQSKHRFVDQDRTVNTAPPLAHIDHGSLAGLADNDHPQYLLTAGKAADSDKLDGVDSTGFATATHNHTGVYLPIASKAADSDKLDGYDSADFGRPVFLTTPLTSTAWEGAARSTTAKTLIDLSVVFGVPAGVKAVSVIAVVRDSASATGEYYMCLSPVNTAGVGPKVACSGLANDKWSQESYIVPCDSNGDIYYQIVASGTGTLDAYLQIQGYWL